jgi:hypothetical protein
VLANSGYDRFLTELFSARSSLGNLDAEFGLLNTANMAAHGRNSLPKFRCTVPFTMHGRSIMFIGRGGLYFVKGGISVFRKIMDRP